MSKIMKALYSFIEPVILLILFFVAEMIYFFRGIAAKIRKADIPSRIKALLKKAGAFFETIGLLALVCIVEVRAWLAVKLLFQ